MLWYGVFGVVNPRNAELEIDQNDVPGALLVWRHPEKAVELSVACLGEGVRTFEVDRLARQNLDRFPASHWSARSAAGADEN